jgi:hypothetical protein
MALALIIVIVTCRVEANEAASTQKSKFPFPLIFPLNYHPTFSPFRHALPSWRETEYRNFFYVIYYSIGNYFEVLY